MEKQRFIPEKKEESRLRRRRKKAVALSAVLLSALAAEYAAVSQVSHQPKEPSCLESPFQISCTWDPRPTSTPTHTPVPEHEVTPSITK